MNNQKLINIDNSAIQKLKEITKEYGPKAAIRISISGGGCSGFQYVFKIERQERKDDDFVINENNDAAPIFIDPISFQYLVNSTLFYEIGLMGQHFTIANPQAKSTCGCGVSFDI